MVKGCSGRTALVHLPNAAKLLLNKLSQNIYLVMVLGYLAVLLVYYLRSGLFFQFMLGSYALVALPLVWYLGRTKEFIKNWMPLIVLLLSYEALNGLAGTFASSGNLVSLYSYDKLLWGFNLTGSVQSLWSSAPLTILFVLIYSLHFPLVIIASVFFWYTNKAIYGKYASALILTSYLALATFLIMPTAPPWYNGIAKDPMQDTQGPSALFSSTIAKLSSLIESDKFAAFPSLHTSYITLFSYYTVKAKLSLGLISLPLFVGVLLSTIYLGQHYVIDLVGGVGYAIAVVLLVNKIPRFRSALGF